MSGRCRTALLGLVLALVLPAAAASAQSADDGGVVFRDKVDLGYEVLYENRFTAGFPSPTPVNSAITGLDVAPDGRVYFAEINGAIKVLDVSSGAATTLVTLPTTSGQCIACPEPPVGEAGVHGFALAPTFARTGQVYVSYSVANSDCEVPDNIAGETNAGCYHLSRFTVADDAIDLASEKVLLTWPYSRFPQIVNVGSDGTVSEGHPSRASAHHGGGIEVLPDGSIVVSVGDNTDPEASSGYGPRDPRPQYWFQNAERTSLNPADRRGGLLRVNPDGSVPDDNPFVGVKGKYLFGKGRVPYDPYVLAKGMRNPYHLVADPRSGTIYSGQVGPDARVDDPARGPAGMEELNVIRRGKSGYQRFNGGYPRCLGPSIPYIDYDYESDTSRNKPLDCSSFDKPALWYLSDRWPQLEGSTIMPGLVYRETGKRALADLQDSLLLFDWTAGWLARIPVAGDGTLDVSRRAVDIIGEGFMGAMDAAVGPDGAVYVAEHGTYSSGFDSRIGRVCGDGCRAGASSQGPAATSSGIGMVWPALLGLPALGLTAALRRRRTLL